MLHQSKIILILRTFSARELNQFELFIHSPYFNVNKNVHLLFDAIKNLHPLYDEKNLETDKIYKKIFKEKTDEQKLRYVMTDLTRLAEEFLIQKELEKNELYKKHLLLNTFSSRQLDKYFNQAMTSASDLSEKQNTRDSGYYFHKHLLEENAFLHSLSIDSRGLEDSLQKAIDNLDFYYLINKLKYSSVMLSRQNVVHVSYHNYILDELLDYIRREGFENIPAIAVYYRIVMTFKEPDEESHFHSLKKILREYSGIFTTEELKDIYTLLLNYCIKNYNNGKTGFAEEITAVYMQMLDTRIIFENGKIAPSDFKNIVVMGLRTGKVEWVENFINTYKDAADDELKESNYHYQMAFLYFYKKDFSKTLKMLIAADFNDMYYVLDAKSLLLRTYYELDEESPFSSLAEAFSHYLKRHKTISEYQRELYLNFVKFARKLMSIRNGGKTTKKELQALLAETKNVASLQWIEEKLREV